MNATERRKGRERTHHKADANRCVALNKMWREKRIKWEGKRGATSTNGLRMRKRGRM